MAQTFAQQIASKQNQLRLSRTQRKQLQEQETSARSEFGGYQQEAEKLKSEFANLTFEEYKARYNQLSPNLQQFLKSPDEITAEQQQKVNDAKIELQKALKSYDVRIAGFQKNIDDAYIKAVNTNRSADYEYIDKRQLDINELKNAQMYLSQESGKLDEGYDLNTIWNYAESKAGQDRQRWEGNRSTVKQFELAKKTPAFITQLGDLKLTKDVDYQTYEKAVTKYNQNVAYLNQLKTWSGKVGYENLPQWTQEKINPSAEEWQKQYPTEVLQFDKLGNVIAVQSKALGGTYSMDDYNKKIEQQNKLSSDAKTFVGIVGKDVSFDAPKQSTLSKIWSGTKAFYYASPMGLINKEMGETTTSENALLRNQRTLDMFKPEILGINILSYIKAITDVAKERKEILNEQGNLPNKPSTYLTIPQESIVTYKIDQKTGEIKTIVEKQQDKVVEFKSDNKFKFEKGFWEEVGEKVSLKKIEIGMPFQIPLYKFGSIPYETAYKTVQKQRGFDYEAQQSEIFLQQLEKYDVSPEMKPFVMYEGMKLLQEKGVEMKEVKDSSGITTIEVTDKSFDKRISQVDLEFERDLERKDYFMVGLGLTRKASLKAVESYGLWKGAGYVFKGAGTLYKGLGLPTVKFMKTIETAGGVAVVPRDFSSLKTIGIVGISGLYGYQSYKEYQSDVQTIKGGEISFAVGKTGELIGIEMATGVGRNTYNWGANKIKRYTIWKGDDFYKQADISNQGFMRMNKKLGFKERVYMERYEGMKLSKPKSWLQTLQGYEKGQFTERSKKLISDEVMSYYKYGGDYTLYPKGTKLSTTWSWDAKTSKLIIGKGDPYKLLEKTGTAESIRGNYGDIIYDTQKVAITPTRVIRAEAFPFDAKDTHLKWFMKKNIQEYGIGKYSKLPIDVKGKGFGYSATGEAWTSNEFEKNVIFYDTGIIKTKGAVQYYSGKGVSAGFLRIFSKGAEEGAGKTATNPKIYSTYFDKVQINKALREVRGVDLSGRELKAYLYSKETGSAGTLNIPLSKREVEGTVEVSKRIPIRRSLIKLNGWYVPVEESIMGSSKDLSSKEIKNIIKSVGSVKEIAGEIPSSSLPPRSTLNSAIYSLMGYSKPSRVSKVSKPSGSSNISRIMSEISKMSEISQISKPSRTSRSSVSSLIRSELSDISRISYAPYSSITYKSPKPSSVVSSIISQIKGKSKIKVRKTKDIELFGLMPDFTARAIGLSPKEYSVKDALKEMRKIQTGFEVRTGGRIKGYSPIDEKQLLAGIMK